MTTTVTRAHVYGEPLVQLPDDLYIPPQALEVFLESFEGPLDLLLYLIRRHRLDISTISVQAVAHQYLAYVELMRESQLDLASEYLVMAATLAELKSRTLLPRPAKETEDAEEEEDPQAELVRRLQEYERFKEAAEKLDQLPRQERDFFVARTECGPITTPTPEANLTELLDAFRGILQRSRLHQSHQVTPVGLTVRQRMSEILSWIGTERVWRFSELFDPTEGREGCIVSFLALLELARNQLVELTQVAIDQPLYVRPL